MICPNCKKEIQDGSKFCVYCGSNIENAKPINSVKVAFKPVKKGDHKILVLLSYLFISLAFLFIIGSIVFNILAIVDNAFVYMYMNTYGGFMFAASMLIITGVTLQIIYTFIGKSDGKNYGIFSFVLECLTLFFFLLTCFWVNDSRVLFVSLFWIIYGIGLVCLIAGFIISIQGYKVNYKNKEEIK
jgi:hypothetical protein